MQQLRGVGTSLVAVNPALETELSTIDEDEGKVAAQLRNRRRGAMPLCQTLAAEGGYTIVEVNATSGHYYCEAEEMGLKAVIEGIKEEKEEYHFK